jgi:hypothetical protein
MLLAEDHRRAKARAVELDISLAEYIRRVIARDLGDEPQSNISAIFDLGDSGGSDVSQHKDEYLGEAAWRDFLRSTGQSER